MGPPVDPRLLLLPVLLFLPPSGHAQPLTSAADHSALHSLRSSLGLRASYWPFRADPCTRWPGVACCSGRVASLSLRAASLSGPIPPDLASLLPPNLSLLDLSRNSLFGALPASLLSLPRLDVSANSLTGELPDLTSNATTGGFFNLSSNFFYGSVPPSIAPFADTSNNCFSNVADQRSMADCKGFYRKERMVFDEMPSPLPGTTDTPASSTGKSSSNWKYILAGTLGGIALLIVLIAVLVIFLMKRRIGEEPAMQPASSVNGIRSPSTSGASLKPAAVGYSFAHEQLFLATSGFSEANIIKHGHTGDIFHGILEDGVRVAVKRIDASTMNKEACAAELSLFAKVSHERLVTFLGHCSEDEHGELLVYKYTSKGDLTSALHKKPGDEEEGLPSLDWITRLKIARGVTEALCFLHQECSPPLVHRDIQASSVLLDDKFEVRLGSLSETCAQQADTNQGVFSRILRSSKTLDKDKGIISGPPAACSYDIFCLGKLLMELVTGNIGISSGGADAAATPETLENILACINIYDKDDLMKVVDPSLMIDEDFQEEVWAMALVARACLNPKPARRPPARFVLKALENPSRVARDERSAGLGAVSSRSSWLSAFRGSSHQGSDAFSMSGRMRGDHSFRISGVSQGSGEFSFSLRRSRSAREIVPEPSAGLESDVDG